MLAMQIYQTIMLRVEHAAVKIWLIVLLTASFSLSSFCLSSPTGTAPPPPGIMVVYPPQGAVINSSTTFLIGSAPPGSQLTCQGQAVKLNKQGYFAHIVNLTPGLNKLILNAGSLPALAVTVNRELPAISVPAGKLAFVADSAQPAADVAVCPGDIVPFAIKATPGQHLRVWLGRQFITLHSGTPVASERQRAINSGLDAAYGKAFQRQAAYQPDLYYGFYKVRTDDHWRQITPQFVISSDSTHLKFSSPAHLTVVEQPVLVRTAHDNTIVRVGPAAARTTSLPSAVALVVDGWQGAEMRCLLSPGQHVWIAKKDLIVEKEGGPAPTSTVRTVNVEQDATGVTMSIPLDQRLPYQIEQQLHPNCVILRIFGATADTDWIFQAPAAVKSSFWENATWRQSGDRVYELTAHLLPGRQWGFDANYDGTTLVARLRAPLEPRRSLSQLAGAIICLDPGHGGSETGAIGPSGIKESTVNLAVAQRLRALLESAGAKVVMTRNSDDESVSLSERVKLASESGAQLLLSIHNNALPDGRDPLSEHGTSSYWYQPQALELARVLKDSLVKETGLPDYGTHYQNLALCRPSNMVAALVEVGFMINPDEYAQLITAEFQEKAARALFSAICRYIHPESSANTHECKDRSPQAVQVQ